MKCKICKRKATGIIRGVDVCNTCFYLFKEDNLKRKPILPKDLRTLRKCKICRTEYLVNISYVKNLTSGLEVSPFLCYKCKT